MRGTTRQSQAALRPVIRHIRPHCHLNLRELRYASTTSAFIGPGYQPRDLPTTYDIGTPASSISLGILIDDVLSECGVLGARRRQERGRRTSMPFGHHLVYFPPDTPLKGLSSDGADALYSPGSPFTRRLWSGGEIKSHGLMGMRGSGYYCTERITDVSVRGMVGHEKAFVNILRRIYEGYEPPQNVDETRYCPLEERRTLVFMRGHVSDATDTGQEGDTASGNRSEYLEKKVSQKRTVISYKPRISGQQSHLPDFAFPMIPSAALLFRFSALTQNHHRIHFDKQYCQDVEGYQDLLVQGPLGVILMLDTLRRYVLDTIVKDKNIPFNSIVQPVSMYYKHISPLFVNEQMVVCGKQVEKKIWNLWIEGPDGRLAVRARVDTEDWESIKVATRFAQPVTKSNVSNTLAPKIAKNIDRGRWRGLVRGQLHAAGRETTKTTTIRRVPSRDNIKNPQSSFPKASQNNSRTATVAVTSRNTDQAKLQEEGLGDESHQ